MARRKDSDCSVTLEDKERELLETVKALGPGWHDRQSIAAYLAKNRLNPVEVTALELLVRAGKLEKEMQPTVQPHIHRWAYRVKETDVDS
jgi:hypothetical protein